MGCFPTCFTSSSSKRRLKHHNSIKPTLSEHQVIQTSGFIQPYKQARREENVGKLINLIRESSKEEVEDQVNCGAKKRVTFDLNVKACEESSAKKKSSCDLVENNEDGKKRGKEEETPKKIESLFDASTLSKVVSLNPNNRYQACRKSTDEYEDIGLEVSDLEGEEEDDDIDDDEPSLVQEESSESLFSLSIDSRKQTCDTEKGEKEVNSQMSTCSLAKDEVKVIGLCRTSGKRCRFGDSVLNPIENLTQWKEVKQRPIPQHVQHQDKENVSFEPCLRSVNHSSKPKLSETKPAKQEIGVDTSLSSWLVGCEEITKSNCDDSSVGNHESEIANSPGRPENGQILGDLAIDGLNQYSGSSPLTRSRSQSPDAKTPMIGTVWSYWVHTGRNMDSDSSGEMPKTARENRKDQKVHFNSHSFESRLDKALDTSVC